jgi:cell division protein FtsI (penicillin-binding protein 3)
MAMDALKRTQWLASTVLIGTALLLTTLLGRVVWIQRHVTGDERERLARQITAVNTITPAVGNICASDGTVLAASVRKYNLFADPAFIIDPEGKLSALKGEDIKKAQDVLVEALSPLVKKPADELLFTLESSAEHADGRPRRFLWLAKEVNEDFYKKFLKLRSEKHEESRAESKEANKTKDKALREAKAAHARVLFHAMDGVGFVTSVRREYPLGPLACHVLGGRNRYEGIDGMERQLDFLLRGLPGQMLETKDASRHTLLIQDQHYTPADDGRNVWLTVDTVIQGVAEEELAKAIRDNNAEGGTAVVMDPFTGRILAIANFPFFDPNQFGSADPKARRNKADTDPYEPGSIFKPFVMAGAIENHLVRPTDVFNCHGGRWNDPTGRQVRDTHGYDMLTAQDVLVKSSNIGMTQVGWRMGIPLLYETITKFGFGQRTGVELPGDQKGLVRPLSVWNKGTLTSVSFGYEVAATPLQLLRGYATFANGGYLVTPRIIHAVEDQPGRTVPWTDVAGAPIQKQILSTQTCDTMRTMMEGVYTYGTAKSARSHMYRLFGKTGTAHIAGKAGNAGNGYAANDYNSSFLCGGPMTDPRLVVIVTVNKPHGGAYFGGTVAAPAATAIAERALMYLQVPGDQVAEAPGPRRTTGH